MSFNSDLENVSSETSDAEHLIQALDQLLEGDFQSRWEATKWLSTLGPQAIALLVPLLEDEDLDWEIRWFAARTLSTFDEAEALDALIRLLQQTQEPELIAIAAESLSHFEEKGISTLIDLLELPAHRLTAIQALANIRHTAVLIPLLAAAADTNPAVRKVAIAALGNFREPQVDDVLLKAVKDTSAAVRQEAILNLGMRSNLLATVNLVDILLPGLWDLNPKVNQATVIALGRLGTQTAVSSLARVLTSPHTPIALQQQIVRALGWIEKESALIALMSARQTTPISVQVEIVEVLTRLQSPALRQQASALLADWLERLFQAADDVSVLKRAIALALGNLHNQEAKPLLEAMMSDRDAQTCLYAEAALRQLSS